VLGISLSAFLAGDRNFTTCSSQAAAGATGLFLDRRQARIVCSRRVAPGVRNLHAVGKRLDARRLQGLPEIGVVDVWRLDRHEAESNGDLLANVQDP
jgi:prolyl oligopeptidase